jgi:hypothetical protein
MMDRFSLLALVRARFTPDARCAPSRSRFRPRLESLEDRLTPASTAIAMPATMAVADGSTLGFSPTTGGAISLSGDVTGNPETVFLQANAGTLQVTNSAGTALYNNGGSLIGVTGTQAQINTALQSLVFTPPAGTTNATDYIDALVSGTNVSGQTLINVTNTSPTITGPTSLMVSPNTLTVFSPNNGNAIAITDAGAGSTGLVTVYIQSLHSSFAVPAGNSLASVVGNGTNSLALTGTVSTINGALNGLMYQLWPGVTSDFFNVMATDGFGTTGRTNTATLGTFVTDPTTTTTPTSQIIANASGSNGPTLTLMAPNGDTAVLNPNTGITVTTGGTTSSVGGSSSSSSMISSSFSAVKQVLSEIEDSGLVNVTAIAGSLIRTATLSFG